MTKPFCEGLRRSSRGPMPVLRAGHSEPPIEMEGTSALPEAPLRLVPAQVARAVSGDRGAGRKHFQFQQGPIFVLSDPFHSACSHLPDGIAPLSRVIAHVVILIALILALAVLLIDLVAASESGRLCRGDRGHGRGHRRRRALMLAILYPHVLQADVPMKRALAILGSVIFLVIAPGTLAGYGPWAICRWRMAPPFFGFLPIRMVGVLLIAAGLPVLLDSFARFAIQGLGTPAPVAPPQRLVVTGLYRYVRNPIYVALVSLIFGQGLFFSSVGVLEYGLAVWLGFFAWVLIFEEPTLRGKFGKDYEDYCARVPPWIPRLRR